MKLRGKRCQCAACGLYFKSPSGFDRHRYGPYTLDPKTRRCLTVTELLQRGWSLNAAGFWLRPSNGREMHVRARQVTA